MHNADFEGYVFVGEHDQEDPNDGQIVIKIKETHVHPLHLPETGSWWDFAVLVLEEEVEYSESVQPIALPEVNKYYIVKKYIYDPQTVFAKRQNITKYVYLYMCKLLAWRRLHRVGTDNGCNWVGIVQEER